jgi:hypothetical protein
MADVSLLTNQGRLGIGLLFTEKDEVAKFMKKQAISTGFYIILVQNDYDLRKSEKELLTGLC